MATSAMSSLENGVYLLYILQNGATKVVKALLLKRIRELKPAECDADEWTLSAFLKANEGKILKSRTGRNNEWMYFPIDSDADICTWDLKAIIYILIETCKLEKVMIMYSEQLAKMRDKFVHAASTCIEENKYEHYLTKITVILNKCLKEIGEEELAREIEEMNGHVKNRTIFSAKIISGHQVRATVTDGREALEKQDGVADETTAQKLDTNIELFHKFEPAMAADNRTENVPELKLTIEVKNCTGDMKVAISQRMVDIFNDVIHKKYDDFREQSDEFRHKLKDAVYETCMIFLSNGRQVKKAEEKCILLHIRCVSLVSLLVLFRDYIDGILDNNIQVLQSAVRRCSGYENTCLEVIVYKDDLWRILTQIAEDLRKYVSSKDKSEQEKPPNGKTPISSGKVLVTLDKASPMESKDGMDESMQQHSTTDKNTLPSERHTQRTGEEPSEESDKKPKTTDKKETEKRD